MTKSVSAGMATHLGLSSTTLALCFQVRRSDGTIIAGTQHDKPLTIDIGDGNGSVTYQPAVGFSSSAVEALNTFKPASLTVSGPFESIGVTKADLRAGRYWGALAKVFFVNWQALADGVVPLGAYLPGEATAGLDFELQLRGVIDRLSNDIVTEIAGPCHLELGEPLQCRVQLDPPAWTASTAVIARGVNDAQTFGGINVVKPTSFNDRQFWCATAGTTGGSEPAWNTTLDALTSDGSAVWQTKRALTLPVTVATVVSQREFTVNYTGDGLNELFRDGRATFTGGANNGITREIKTWTLGTKTVVCFQGFPDTIAVSDPLNLVAGCDKDETACSLDFGNIRNYGGHPNIPSVWVIIQKP